MGEKMQEKQGGNSGIVAQFKRFDLVVRPLAHQMLSAAS